MELLKADCPTLGSAGGVGSHGKGINGASCHPPTEIKQDMTERHYHHPLQHPWRAGGGRRELFESQPVQAEELLWGHFPSSTIPALSLPSGRSLVSLYLLVWAGAEGRAWTADRNEAWRRVHALHFDQSAAQPFQLRVSPPFDQCRGNFPIGSAKNHNHN
jgi:hypothetical protein